MLITTRLNKLLFNAQKEAISEGNKKLRPKRAGVEITILAFYYPHLEYPQCLQVKQPSL